VNTGQFSIKWNKESGAEVQTHLPDWKEVDAVALQISSTLLYKKLDHPYFRKPLGLQHALYNGKVAIRISM